MVADSMPRPSRDTAVRDIVVIGCSAGGIDALSQILERVSRDLPAAVLIVQHIAATSPRLLAEILGRGSPLPVQWAEQGDKIRAGRVLIAPPDVHLMVGDGHVQLSGGAHENHSRPSINKLFRSAAAVYGSRVIGVLLTGMLDDGVAGLCAIRDAGGFVIVQDPRGAAFPEMPTRALIALTPDKVLPLAEIGPALTECVGQQVGAPNVPEEIALEAEIDRDGTTAPEKLSRLGAQTTVSCPTCHGPTWLVGDQVTRRFRCYLGHVTSARELLEASTQEVDSALWGAVRALRDRATALESLVEVARRTGGGATADHYVDRARETRRHADIVRQLMLELNPPT
jgi:two-component system chemotaxis response regulator CheB